MKNAIKVLSFVLAIIILAGAGGLVYFKWDVGEFIYIDGTEKNTAIITQYTGDSVNITIPDRLRGKKVIAIDDSAFLGTDIESFTTNKYVTSIGINAFKDCKNLKSVTIGKSVRSIGNNCFVNCSSLEEVTLSSSVEKLGVLLFGNDASLKRVTFEDNENFKIVDDVIYSADMTTVYCALPYADLSSYTLPSQVSNLKGYAFYNHAELKKININDGIKTIPEGVFGSCSSLTDIVLPSSVTRIDNIPFTPSGLKTITIPSSVTTINSAAFYNIEKQVTIITTANSYAERFAKEQNLKYKLV